jgi:hypothetical protein
LPPFLHGTTLGAYDLLPLEEKFDDFKNKDFSFAVRNSIDLYYFLIKHNY